MKKLMMLAIMVAMLLVAAAPAMALPVSGWQVDRACSLAAKYPQAVSSSYYSKYC